MDINYGKVDYDKVLYYYNALRAGKKPKYDLLELVAMKKNIEKNNSDDEMLVYMINYVLDRLKK